MLEAYRRRPFALLTGLAIGAAILEGCSVDSYLTDPANVKCDGTRTIANLVDGGDAIFIVHGSQKGAIATITVRRENSEVSAAVSGDVTGPPQQLQPDGFTKPVPIIPGPELSTFGAGGVWILDARKNSVVIQGTCEGM